ncbi:EF-hand domain-containing protein [Flaviflagellibacter deserti]|jgi:Ca2+-binding EF-hand superfamily protein|uniref:EF-hand domain-containing protein n=1 Tax=Flaviflagellibacter deserti TaxID=2267266 RepID=A0ABV9Z1Z4_9HYPH
MKTVSKRLLIGTAIVGLLALPVAAGAVAPVSAEKAGEGRGGKFVERMFDKLDANKDGVVDKAEFDAFRAQRIDATDENKDGFLDRKEVRESRREMRQEWRKHAGLMGRDSDGNGEVSRDEFLAGPEARFDKLDTNHDGKLDQSEIDAARKAMRDRRERFGWDERGEHPRHHHWERSEWRGGDDEEPGRKADRGPMTPMRGLMAELRREGEVSRADVEASTDRLFKEFDINGDGRVTREEAQKTLWSRHGNRG